MIEALLTEDEVVAALKLPNREALRHLRRTAGLPYLHVGRRVRFWPTKLKQWLAKQEKK